MSNTVIVLEGPDGAGKSTLAAHLVTDYGFNYIHVSKPKPGEDLFKTYSDLLMSALDYDQPVVFDRLHLGEVIYGPIMRGTDQLSPTGVRLLHRVFAARGVKMILCLPHIETWGKQLEERGDDYVTRMEQAEQIYHAYRSFVDENPQFPVYDWETTSTLERDAMLFEPLRTLPYGCTGSPLAKYLIVGDEVNRKVLEHDLPFHHLGNSSAYLHRALEMTKRREDYLAFTNAKWLGGHPRDLSQVVARLPNFKHAIALGRTAEKALTKYGIRHTYVEHPSCAKRFKHYQLEEYSQQLKEALK